VAASAADRPDALALVRSAGVATPAADRPGPLALEPDVDRVAGTQRREPLGRRRRRGGEEAAPVHVRDDPARRAERDHPPQPPLIVSIAMPVASGLADAGVAVRSAAAALRLDFIPLAWEPFDLALSAESLPRAEPLLAALAGPTVARRAAELGGYDLEGSGTVRPVG
jgi:hypothetical protein